MWLLPVEGSLLALFAGGGLVTDEAEGPPQMSSQCYVGSESGKYGEGQGEECAVRSASYGTA